MILGCTHYPVIKDIISDIMGNDITLISPGAEAAKYAQSSLMEKDMLSEEQNQAKILTM